MRRSELTLVLGLVVLAGAAGATAGIAAEPKSEVTPPPGASAEPCPPAGTAAPATAPPATAAPTGGEVALLPVEDITAPRTYTVGDTAIVDEVVQLELVEASRGWIGDVAPPPGQTGYTYLVRFTWDGTQPEGFPITGAYYNVIGFSMRDDEGFEYPVMHGASFARQPALLFGEVASGQSVQGWVTFNGPEDASVVELVYSPIGDERVFFQVAAP